MMLLLLHGSNSVQAEEDAFEITFEKDTLSSNSSRSKINVVVFYGTITKANWSSVTGISLEASAPENWSAIAVPSWMSFIDELTHSFQMEVHVPQRVHVDLYTMNLTLTIRNNGTIWKEHDVCHVWVNQYYGVELVSIYNLHHVVKEDTIKGIINISNIGNGPDLIKISVLDNEGLVINENLPVEISVPEFTTITVPYKIKIDFLDRRTGWYNISINITSMGSMENGSALVYNDEAGVPIFIRNVPSTSEFYIVVILGTSSLFIIAILFVLINKYRHKE